MSSLKNYRFWFASILLASSICSADALAPSKQALLASLRHGGFTILMRHASAPREPPDAAHVNADNTKSERQLDEMGIQSARTLGTSLHHLRIPIGEVLSSPTYRALQTVKFAELGQAITYPELGDGGQSMQANQSAARADWLKSRASKVPIDGKNRVIVTHFPNITEAFGQSAAGLADGEALILKPDGRGGVTVVTRLKIDEWAALDHVP